MEPINETALIPDTSAPESQPDTETAREKFEQARLSRRAALRKIGMTSGMALFGLFAVDDLARLAIKKMEQHKETRQVAETVAKEFKDSGIAFAAYYPGSESIVDPPSYTEIGTNCASKPTYYGNGTTTCEGCVAEGCGDNYPSSAVQGCITAASGSCAGTTK